MNDELLLLNKKQTDTLFEQAKTEPKENLDFKKIKHMEFFSPNPPTNLSEERKRLLAVTSFDITNSVFSRRHENNSFSITTPGYKVF